MGKEDDDLLNDLDRLLFNYKLSERKETGRTDRGRSDNDITIFQPFLQSANQILKARKSSGRIAACAVATHQIYPDAKLKILDHCDSVLENIARSTVKAGRTIERMEGERRSDVEHKFERCFRTLRDGLPHCKA